MPECIVCKGYYGSGTVCKRCDSDNGPWLKWRASEPVEEEGIVGLLYFTEPHYHVPFVITAISLAFGLMGIVSLWEGISSAVRLLAVVATVGGCLLIIQITYARRHKLRETELLKQWRIAKRKKKPIIQLRAQWKIILVPVAVVSLILLLTYALVKSEDLWKLAKWLIFEREEEKAPQEPKEEAEEAPTIEQEPPQDDIRTRVTLTIPFISLIGYVSVCLALTYSSSLALARGYTERMNQKLPHPIFLQDERLARVVRKEAEVELGRIEQHPNIINYTGYVKYEEETDPRILRLAPNVDVLTIAASGGPSPPRVEMWGQAATWIWDELERTEDGGIKMKVARQEVYQVPKQTEKSDLHPGARVSYVVRADPWGRVTEIKRDSK